MPISQPVSEVEQARRRLITLATLAVWFLTGVVYFLIEVAYKGLISGGRIHPVMGLVGGLCVLGPGLLNEYPRFFNLPALAQVVIGAVFTTAIEYVAGYILNILMGMGLWDYSHMWGNLHGQICPLFSLKWLVLMLIAIPLEDKVRVLFGDRRWSYRFVDFWRETWNNIVWIVTLSRRGYLYAA